MNNQRHTSGWSSLTTRIGWGVLGCVLLVFAWQSAFDKPAPTAADAATGPPEPHYVHKKIEDIEVGDYVLARNEETGEYASRPVLETYRRVSDHLRILQIQSLADGSLQRIETTDEHPFWVSEQGWVEAGDLQPDDQLSDSSGQAAILVASAYEPHPEGVAVYNFQVADDHSYFVRSGQTRGPPVWVHNADYGNAPTRIPIDADFVSPQGGFVRYSALDELGRPTTMQARITPDMIGTGTPANRRIQPPGFITGRRGANRARGHLLGDQLGGSGDELRNLVTLEQNAANSPVMRDFETSIRQAVEGGQIVDYTVTPLYDFTGRIPRGVTLQARGSGGFRLDVTVLNPPGM